MRTILSVILGLLVGTGAYADVTGGVTPPGGIGATLPVPLSAIAPIATGTIMGAPSVSISGVAITGTAGQISFTASGTVAAGQQITIAGTNTGSGSIANGTYLVAASPAPTGTTATLQTLSGGAIVTTAGTPTGLTYAFAAAPGAVPMGNLLVGNVCAASVTGFCGDTVSVTGSVSCSPGAAGVITVTKSLPAAYVGAKAVVAGCGSIGAKNIVGGIAPVNAGTGYTATNLVTGVAGDTLTVTGGTCTTQPQVQVLTVTGGGATGPIGFLGVTNAGVCTVAPGAAATLSGGTGASATGTFTYIGQPLQGTITAVGTNQFTLNNSAISTLAASSQPWAAGHDDQAAFVAAGAKGTQNIYLPALPFASWDSTVQLQYGQFSEIVLPSGRFNLNCQGATIHALAPMTGQMQTPSNGSSGRGSSISSCIFEGWGQVQYNLDHQSGNWYLENNSYLDATVANLIMQGGNSFNNIAGDSEVINNLSIVPAGSTYLIEVTGAGDTDNQFHNFNAGGSITSGLEIAAAGTFADDMHIYQVFAGPEYDIGNVAGLYENSKADNAAPGQAGFYIKAGANEINDWSAYLANANAGQYGVYVAVDANVTVGCGNAGLTSNWASNLTQVVFNVSGASTNSIAPCAGKALQPEVVSSLTTGQFFFSSVTGAYQATGFGFNNAGSAPVYNDSSTAGGTITNTYLNAFPAFALQNTGTATTYTNVASLRIPAPTCGTGATCSRLFSLSLGGGMQNGGAIQSIGTVFADPTLTTCSGITGKSGGATAGQLTLTTGATPCTIQFTGLPSVPTGYRCSADDMTSFTPLAQSARTTTGCSVKGTVSNGDTIVWSVVQGY